MSRLPVVLIFAGVLAACSAADGASNCQRPPLEETDRLSEIEVTIRPERLRPGTTAEIWFPEAAAEAITGAGAAWQCWDGTEWVDTHQLVKAASPSASAVEPGATTTIHSVGLPAGFPQRIMVPDVSPGTYRISDQAHFGDGRTVTGFIVVAVQGADS